MYDAIVIGTRVLERHRALLLAVAAGMLGHGPQAEDAVHDTFLIALRRIGDVRDPAAARAWLLAILGNVCRAQLRRPATHPVAEVPEPPAQRPVDEAIDRLALRDWVPARGSPTRSAPRWRASCRTLSTHQVQVPGVARNSSAGAAT